MTDIDNFIISGGLTGKTQVIMSVIWFFFVFMYVYVCSYRTTHQDKPLRSEF